ncbi:hypothetical protein Tco_0421833 [Tanacetum coccineum]
MNELNELRDQANENSLIYKEKTKKIHDSKIKNHVFNVGDRFLLFNSRLKIFSGKLKTRWTDRSPLLKFSLMEPSSYLKPTDQISRIAQIMKIPSGESEVHIKVLSVLWGNRLPILDDSLPLSRHIDDQDLSTVTILERGYIGFMDIHFPVIACNHTAAKVFTPFLLWEQMVSTGRKTNPADRLFILSAGRLVSAGRTMILLVVILPAGCFVSDGSYGLCCWFRVHAGGHTSAGGFISAAGFVLVVIMFLLAYLILLVSFPFRCLHFVSAVLSLILLVGWSLPLVTWFLLVVSIPAGVTMYLLPE